MSSYQRKPLFKRRTTMPTSTMPAKPMVPYKRQYTTKFANKSALYKAIQSALGRQIETKKANSQFADDNVGGCLDTAAGTQIIPISPYAGFIQIPQGTGDGQRIGNKITTIESSLNYTLFPNPYNAVSNVLVKPQMVLMFLLRDKKNPTIMPQITDLVANMYNAGSTVTPATGTVKDLTYEMNTDRFQVFKRWTHKLGYAQASVQGVVAANEYFVNNDFKMFIHQITDCTKHLYKHVDFDDGTYYPSTPGVFLFYYTIYVDGSTTADGQYPTQLRLSIDYKYKDA